MKTFNFKRSLVKIESESGTHEVRFPTMLEATEFDKKLIEEGTNHEELIKAYFKKLGLPEEAYNELEYWQVKEILAYFRDPMGKERSAQK